MTDTMDTTERNLAFDRLMEADAGGPVIYGPPVPFVEDIPQRAIDAETIEQLNVKINELTDIIDERDNQIQLNANRFESIENNHRLDKARAVTEAIDDRNSWFVEQILGFDQGCLPGKISFIQYCELEVPTEAHTLTVNVTVPIGTDTYDIRSTLNYAVECYFDNREEPSMYEVSTFQHSHNTCDC